MIWTCQVGQLSCKSWLPDPKIDCPGQSGNLIVAPCLLGRGVNREGFNFKLAMVKTCSTWPLLNKYAL